MKLCCSLKLSHLLLAAFICLPVTGCGGDAGTSPASDTPAADAGAADGGGSEAKEESSDSGSNDEGAAE